MEAHRGHLGLQQLEVMLVSLPRLEVSHKVRVCLGWLKDGSQPPGRGVGARCGVREVRGARAQPQGMNSMLCSHVCQGFRMLDKYPDFSTLGKLDQSGLCQVIKRLGVSGNLRMKICWPRHPQNLPSPPQGPPPLSLTDPPAGPGCPSGPSLPPTHRNLNRGRRELEQAPVKISLKTLPDCDTLID